jgi:hypothetical protein
LRVGPTSLKRGRYKTRSHSPHELCIEFSDAAAGDYKFPIWFSSFGAMFGAHTTICTSAYRICPIFGMLIESLQNAWNGSTVSDRAKSTSLCWLGAFMRIVHTSRRYTLCSALQCISLYTVVNPVNSTVVRVFQAIALAAEARMHHRKFRGYRPRAKRFPMPESKPRREHVLPICKSTCWSIYMPTPGSPHRTLYHHNSDRPKKMNWTVPQTMVCHFKLVFTLPKGTPIEARED